MIEKPLDAPISRREFHMELMIVWLFVVFVSGANIRSDALVSTILVPVVALVMVLLHARMLRRPGSARPTQS